jgi:ribonuclease HI
LSLLINIDGGSRGNPGPAGAGVVIRREDEALVHESAWFLGRQTNNAAEYTALLRALERVTRCPTQPITIYSDSELLVRQLTGEYAVKSAALAPLFRQAQVLLLKVGRWAVRHIPREENGRADELANLAMDRRADVLVFDVDVPAEKSPPAAPRTTPAAAPPGADLPPSAPVPHGPAPSAAQTVRVAVSRRPRTPDGCPAGCFATGDPFEMGAVLPTGLCIHAAHALLPTALAMLNADPQEFAAIPTLTVRCTRPDCGAEFQVTPVTGRNGQRP